MTKQVGESVTFVDPVGKHHEALVTAVWSDICLNIVYVDADENQKDTYGRKMARATSLMKKMEGSAHGNYWID